MRQAVSILQVFFLLGIWKGSSAFSTLPSFTNSIHPIIDPRQTTLSAYSGDSSLSAGDRILIIGGTGGVGQLVTKKLLRSSSNYKVRVTSRNPEKAKEILNDDEIEYVPLDLVNGVNGGVDDLKAALAGVDSVVIATGTTAFPTKKWANGNNPKAVDFEAVKKIADVCAALDMKRVVHLTSVGVERTGEMPFLFLNLFGVLDAKKGGEDSIKASGNVGNYDYAIVRPGRLIGGPYTNEDLAKLLQIEGGAENGVTVATGDDLLGDCKRDACAEVIVQCLSNEACKNVEFSLISNDEPALSTEQWTIEFTKL